MKKSIKGKGAVGIAISYYALQGIVSIPLEPSEYNIIFDNGKKIYRVKVISCSYKTKYGVYSAVIRSSGGNQPTTQVKIFNRDSCDIVFVVTEEFNVYEIPSHEIKSFRQISLNLYESFKIKFYSGLAQWQSS